MISTFLSGLLRTMYVITGVYTVLFSVFPMQASAAINPALRPWYDDCLTLPEGSVGATNTTLVDPGGGAASVNGVDISAPNVRAAYIYLINNLPSIEPGVSQTLIAVHAAGLVGNFMVEAGITVSPTADNGSHYGIAQWDYADRWGGPNGAEQWITATYGPNMVNLITGQIAYVVHELQGRESAALAAISQTTTPAEAAKVVNDRYERSGGAAEALRIQYAEAIFEGLAWIPLGELAQSIGFDDSGGYCAYITGSETSAGLLGGSTVNTTGAGSFDCALAVGTEKILCEAKQYDGGIYILGGGHMSFSAFKAQCPTPDPTSTRCALDCTGLIMVAVATAFGLDSTPNWVTDGFAAGNYRDHWQEVSVGSARPGDVLWYPGHAVIFADEGPGKTYFHASSPSRGIRYDGSSTFQKAFRYIGPGIGLQV